MQPTRPAPSLQQRASTSWRMQCQPGILPVPGEVCFTEFPSARLCYHPLPKPSVDSALDVHLALQRLHCPLPPMPCDHLHHHQQRRSSTAPSSAAAAAAAAATASSSCCSCTSACVTALAMPTSTKAVRSYYDFSSKLLKTLRCRVGVLQGHSSYGQQQWTLGTSNV